MALPLLSGTPRSSPLIAALTNDPGHARTGTSESRNGASVYVILMNQRNRLS